MPDTSPKLRWLFIWKVILCAHLVAAAFGWWFMPHGFAFTHPRFWANQVLPWIIIALCIAGLYSISKHRIALARFIMTGMAATYFTAAIAGAIIFPISGRRPAIPAILFGFLLLCVGWFSYRKCGKHRVATSAGIAAGLLLGILLPLSQRGAAPATHPISSNTQPQPVEGLTEDPPNVIRLADFAALSPQHGNITIHYGPVLVGIEPMLQFISRSPDRCWTIFAPVYARSPRTPWLSNWKLPDANSPTYFGWSQWGTLSIDPPTDNILKLEANTYLSSPIYSHLNSYCTLNIQGHERLFLSFSPCPHDRIEVTYSEYPTGQPARLAYLAANNTFRVVEASSGEKGPFKQLAQGPLKRDEPLTITLYNNDTPVGRITLEDFAAQASTQPSPTAGWRLPENAIEFTLFNNRPDSQAGIWITLAGTSVGRGWDAVGHAPGTYQNRMTCERLNNN